MRPNRNSLKQFSTLNAVHLFFFFNSCCKTVSNFYFPAEFLAQKPETQEGIIVVSAYTYLHIWNWRKQWPKLYRFEQNRSLSRIGWFLIKILILSGSLSIYGNGYQMLASHVSALNQNKIIVNNSLLKKRWVVVSREAKRMITTASHWHWHQ